MDELRELFEKCITFSVSHPPSHLGSDMRVESALNIFFTMPSAIDKKGKQICTCHNACYTMRQVTIDEFKQILR